MLKKPCPYHKGSINHTLKECDMLRKDEAKKKDAGDKGDDGYPSVENVFFIFAGLMANMTPQQRSASAERSSPSTRPRHPTSTSRRTPSPSAARTTPTTSRTRDSTRSSWIPSSATLGSPKCS